MKIGTVIVMVLHALIHLLGFVKAFNFAEISELTLPISRSHGDSDSYKECVGVAKEFTLE